MNNYHIHRKFERGETGEDEFIRIMLDVLENKVSREEFCDVYSKVFIVDKKVTGLLPLLKENYKLVLLSNTNPIHRKYGWGSYDFLKYFDKLGIREKSNEVGEKDLYDLFYDYDSSFAHALWGAIRESAMLPCDNAGHQYHSIPDIYANQKLPDIKADSFKIININL